MPWTLSSSIVEDSDSNYISTCDFDSFRNVSRRILAGNLEEISKINNDIIQSCNLKDLIGLACLPYSGKSLKMFFKQFFQGNLNFPFGLSNLMEHLKLMIDNTVVDIIPSRANFYMHLILFFSLSCQNEEFLENETFWTRTINAIFFKSTINLKLSKSLNDCLVKYNCQNIENHIIALKCLLRLNLDDHWEIISNSLFKNMSILSQEPLIFENLKVCLNKISLNLSSNFISSIAQPLLERFLLRNPLFGCILVEGLSNNSNLDSKKLIELCTDIMLRSETLSNRTGALIALKKLIIKSFDPCYVIEKLKKSFISRETLMINDPVSVISICEESRVEILDFFHFTFVLNPNNNDNDQNEIFKKFLKESIPKESNELILLKLLKLLSESLKMEGENGNIDKDFKENDSLFLNALKSKSNIRTIFLIETPKFLLKRHSKEIISSFNRVIENSSEKSADLIAYLMALDYESASLCLEKLRIKGIFTLKSHFQTLSTRLKKLFIQFIMNSINDSTASLGYLELFNLFLDDFIGNDDSINSSSSSSSFKNLIKFELLKEIKENLNFKNIHIISKVLNDYCRQRNVSTLSMNARDNIQRLTSFMIKVITKKMIVNSSGGVEDLSPSVDLIFLSCRIPFNRNRIIISNKDDIEQIFKLLFMEKDFEFIERIAKLSFKSFPKLFLNLIIGKLEKILNPLNHQSNSFSSIFSFEEFNILFNIIDKIQDLDPFFNDDSLYSIILQIIHIAINNDDSKVISNVQLKQKLISLAYKLSKICGEPCFRKVGLLVTLILRDRKESSNLIQFINLDYNMNRMKDMVDSIYYSCESKDYKWKSGFFSLLLYFLTCSQENDKNDKIIHEIKSENEENDHLKRFIELLESINDPIDIAFDWQRQGLLKQSIHNVNFLKLFKCIIFKIYESVQVTKEQGQMLMNMITVECDITRLFVLNLLNIISPFDLDRDQELVLWSLQHDEISCKVAMELWIKYHSDSSSIMNASTCTTIPSTIDYTFMEALKKQMMHASSQLLSNCLAGSFVDILQFETPDKQKELLEELFKHYQILWNEKRPPGPRERVINIDLTLLSRLSISSAICQSIEILNFESNIFILKFIINHGLWDHQSEIHDLFLNSFQRLLDKYPESNYKEIVDTIELNLNPKQKRNIDHEKGEGRGEGERIRIFNIILLGKICQKTTTQQDSSKLERVINLLVTSLSNTSSESTQIAIFTNLKSLIHLGKDESFMKNQIQILYSRFYEICFREDKKISTSDTAEDNDRRGAIYGMAALLKSCGISSIKTLGKGELLKVLMKNLSCPKEVNIKVITSSLYLVELLANDFVKTFEPYAIELLSSILISLSEDRLEIKDSAIRTTASLIKCFSSFGIHIIFPILMKILNEMEQINQRSKIGALYWLGELAILSSSPSPSPSKILLTGDKLSMIIPKITSFLTDPHIFTQRAASQALIKYGSIILNPEIKSLMTVIIAALSDPPKNSLLLLDSLLNCCFSHVIDGPSLCLIEPILERSLRNGNAEEKKKASQIIANLATSLVDAKDFAPYLNVLVPILCDCIGDSIPQVRSHIARVLGILFKVRLIDGRPSQSVDSLISTLQTKMIPKDALSVTGKGERTIGHGHQINLGIIERSGAAQALAEILAVQPIEKSKEYLTSIVKQGLTCSRFIERESWATMLGFLPESFDFNDSLLLLYDECGLSELMVTLLFMAGDDNEHVREASLKSSRIIIRKLSFTISIVPLLLSLLREGRGKYRLAGMQLLNEYLVSLAQECRKSEEKAFNESENNGEMERVGGSIDDNQISAINLPSLNELTGECGLSKDEVSLIMTFTFFSRFDPFSSQIRNTALNIWKVLAVHPPRAMMSILPHFQFEACNVGHYQERRIMLRKAYDELFEKLGDRIMPEIMSNFEKLLIEKTDSMEIENKNEIEIETKMEIENKNNQKEQSKSNQQNDNQINILIGILQNLCIISNLVQGGDNGNNIDIGTSRTRLNISDNSNTINSIGSNNKRGIKEMGDGFADRKNMNYLVEKMIHFTKVGISFSNPIIQEEASLLFESILSLLNRFSFIQINVNQLIIKLILPMIERNQLDALSSILLKQPKIILEAIIPPILNDDLELFPPSFSPMKTIAVILRRVRGRYSAPYANDLIKKFIECDNQESEELLKACLYSISISSSSCTQGNVADGTDQNENDEDDEEAELSSIYLSALLEDLYSNPKKRIWALIIIRIYTSEPEYNDLSRLYAVWLNRLLETAFYQTENIQDYKGMKKGENDGENRELLEAKKSLISIYEHFPNCSEEEIIQILQVMTSVFSIKNETEKEGKEEEGGKEGKSREKSKKINNRTHDHQIKLSCWHQEILGLMIKNIIIPSLNSNIITGMGTRDGGDNNVGKASSASTSTRGSFNDRMEMARNIDKGDLVYRLILEFLEIENSSLEFERSFGSSNISLLLGAIIRVLLDSKRKVPVISSLTLHSQSHSHSQSQNREAIIIHIRDQMIELLNSFLSKHVSLTRPFYPQLIKIFQSLLPIEGASKAIKHLLPVISDPIQILMELIEMIMIEDDEYEEQGNNQISSIKGKDKKDELINISILNIIDFSLTISPLGNIITPLVPRIISVCRVKATSDCKNIRVTTLELSKRLVSLSLADKELITHCTSLL